MTEAAPGGPPAVSVVIPAFNEEANVEPCYRELAGVLGAAGLSFEIVFVDDGSTDGTPAALRQLAREDSRVRVLRLRRNAGQTAALDAGFRAATGAVVITMDADLQNDPHDIPRMLDALAGDVDVVNGWRTPRQDPFLTRRLPSYLANRLINVVTGTELHDYGCTLRAMRAPVAKQLQLYGELHRFIPALAADVGARMSELPVHHRPRTIGRSKYGLSRTLRVLLDLLTVKFLSGFATRPIQLFGLFGLLCAGVGALLGATLVVEKVVYGERLAGRPLLLFAVLAVVVGVQFISIGLLGEMMVRTYHESQAKPIYRVREVCEPSRDD
jgi:glycosyltransferase involved in cell wall biosynthesis